MGTNSVSLDAGIMPDINSLAAGVIIVGVYLVRIGIVAEGGTPSLFLQLTTDCFLPLLAAMWLLVVPTAHVLKRIT